MPLPLMDAASQSDSQRLRYRFTVSDQRVLCHTALHLLMHSKKAADWPVDLQMKGPDVLAKLTDVSEQQQLKEF